VSALILADREYREPDTTLDSAFVAAYSAAWCLTAPSVLALARPAASGPVTIVAWLAAVVAVTTGVVNAIEDGAGVHELGRVYLVTFFVAWLSLLALAAVLW
jgi:hypothetical protein